MRRLAPVLVLPLLVVLAAPASAADVPPSQPATIGTALAPGNSGYFSVPGEARGRATRDPGQYGEHVDDQRVMLWQGEYKDGRFKPPVGTPQTPRPGVRIYEDEKGVPVVYGDTGDDVWFGAGWAAGQSRLFLADAVRRLGRGTYAALVGPSGVPVDVQQRTLTYSEADYAAMLAALPQEAQDVFASYAAGLDAWITHVRRTPADLPAEYVLLSTLPEPWTVTDTLAASVLLTRTVAATGGDEFREVTALRELQAALGPQAGAGAFEDLRWHDDAAATTSIAREDGVFDNDPVPAQDRPAVFAKSAAYALGLPPELATGPGTGAFPVPAVPGGADPSLALPAQVRASLRTAVDSLLDFRLQSGSYAFAVSGERTSTGAPMLVSGPQVGYSYPNQLFEIEVHGGGYDVRGVIVPGLPTVAIGYNDKVAWGLTSGYSKTVDSFIETVRRVDGRLQHLHRGTWKDADCRTETIPYRQAVSGLPVGPPVATTSVEVCRTVHGPVVATSADGTLARSVSYAMAGRELDNINGILAWGRARDLDSFAAGVRQVTWNENVVYAGSDGRIAFWHPGLYPRRSPSWDLRFPAPGTGEHDWDGFLPFEQMPQVVDPAAGYVANWNEKPAVGWTNDHFEPASTRTNGRGARVQTIQRLLAAEPRLTPERLREVELRLGLVDQRAPEFLPLLQRLEPRTASQETALALLRSWDGTAYGPGAGTGEGALTDASVTDGPAPTVFRRFMDELRDELLQDLPRRLVLESDGVGSHVWDVSPVDNLALRVLVPGASALTPSRDYTGGRSADDVLRAAVDRTVAVLTAQYGADPAAWRDVHPRRSVRSLTGVIGPSLTMPYQDRGSWVHVVAFDDPTPTAEPVQVGAPGRTASSAGPRLPATGAETAALWGGLVLLLAAVALRRRTVGPVADLDGVRDDDLAG